MLVRFAILLILSIPLVFAQKKPVTLDDIIPAHDAPKGPGAPVWAPDGKSFAYLENGKVMLYEIGPKSARELFAIATLEQSARPAPADEKFDWENRQVRDENLQWFPSGKELLIAASGDLFV